VLVLGTILLADFAVRQTYLALLAKGPFRSEKNGATGGADAATSPQPEKSHRSSHPVFHHGFQPLTQGEDVFGSTRTPYFINSAGFRDESCREVDLGSSQKKILIIGDSYAEGIGVPWEMTFAGILQKSFSSTGVEVLNAAAASYCPSLMQARLEYLYQRQKLRADVVVVFIDISDVEDELSYKAVPSGGFVLERLSPWDNPELRTWDLTATEWVKNNLEKNFTLLGAASRNLRLLWRRWGSPGGTPELTRSRWPEYRGPGEVLIRQGLERAARAMDKIHALTDAHQGKLLVVIYPWREQVESGKQPSWMEVFWQDWARHQGVKLVNFFPSMLAMGEKFEKEFCIAGDGHWNAAGHAAVASRLKPELEYLLR